MKIIKNIAVALAVCIVALAPVGCIRPIAIAEDGEIVGGLGVSPLASVKRVRDGEAAAQQFGEELAENQKKLADGLTQVGEGQAQLAEGQARLAEAAGDLRTKAEALEAKAKALDGVEEAIDAKIATTKAQIEKEGAG